MNIKALLDGYLFKGALDQAPFNTLAGLQDQAKQEEQKQQILKDPNGSEVKIDKRKATINAKGPAAEILAQTGALDRFVDKDTPPTEEPAAAESNIELPPEVGNPAQ